ncbi:MAG: protoporphyrinogen/coproporphyrinogen oxidase [Syntrophomonadaceae bacterium]
MAGYDVIVVGGGVSGASFAFQAARAGRRTLLLEREDRFGGCLHTAAGPDGFWFELGAHTCYNSYGALIEMLEGCGLMASLQPRAKPRLRFLEGDRVLPGQNLGLLLRLMNKAELAVSLPRAFGAKQDGQTVRSYYSRIVGPGNYARVLGPMLSAVPSQTADDLPADMLFKSRPRRKDVLRSFTLRGGLQRVCEAAVATPGVTAKRGAAARSVERIAGGGFAVTLADGSREEAGTLALATSPGEAASLLRGALPEVAARLARIREVSVDTLGVVVPAAKVARIPSATFLIPRDDVFFSVVTRDAVPDPSHRAFTLHFRPGLSAQERLDRATRLLGVGTRDLEAVAERRTILPSPVLGHREIVRELDGLLEKTPLALSGNWFSGLSIEDCVQRSRSEWGRVARV